jgi:hypothetical protein
MPICMLRRLALLAVALAVAACAATTTIQSAWYDQSYHGGAFRKIVVVGIHQEYATTRQFEDIFAAQLREAGVQAVPGYQVLSNYARFGDPAWNAAIEASGADGLISVRLLNIDTRTQVSTMLIPAEPGWGPYGPGWGGWGPYGPGWGAPVVAVPQVTQYDVATVETDLWDVKTRRVVYAATTSTINPAAVPQETPGFASLIIGQLKARGLLAVSR